MVHGSGGVARSSEVDHHGGGGGGVLGSGGS